MKTFKTQQSAVYRAKRLLTAVYNGSPFVVQSWIHDCTHFVYIPHVGGYHVKKVNNMFTLVFDR